MVLLAADPIERPGTLFGEADADRGMVSGGPTLDDAIVGAWEGLVARLAVTCPVCGARRMRPGPRAGGSAVVGRCEHCAASLG
jgi:hypothetical protein